MNCLEKIKEFKFYLSLDDKYKNILSKRFKKINWEEAANDEYAILLMEKYFEKNDWFELSSGSKEVIPFFEKHPRFIHWTLLSCNPYSCHILEKNLDKLDKISWKNLSGNAGAVDIIKKNLDKVYWKHLSINTGAIDIIEKNLDKVDWRFLCHNTEALHLLENNFDKIFWPDFDRNPKATVLIENMINKGKARMLLDNKDAVWLLNSNMYKINWDKLTISQQEKDAIIKEVNKERSNYFNSL